MCVAETEPMTAAPLATQHSPPQAPVFDESPLLLPTLQTLKQVGMMMYLGKIHDTSPIHHP